MSAGKRKLKNKNISFTKDFFGGVDFNITRQNIYEII